MIGFRLWLLCWKEYEDQATERNFNVERLQKSPEIQVDAGKEWAQNGCSPKYNFQRKTPTQNLSPF